MIPISVFHYSKLDLSLAMFSLSNSSMLNVAVNGMLTSGVTPANYLPDVSNSLQEIFNRTHYGPLCVILRA